jgi:hypothetical protein
MNRPIAIRFGMLSMIASSRITGYRKNRRFIALAAKSIASPEGPRFARLLIERLPARRLPVLPQSRGW